MEDSLVTSALAELRQLEHDRDFPHINEKTLERLKAEVSSAEQALETAQIRLRSLERYVEDLPQLIEVQRDRLHSLRESTAARTKLGTTNKVNELLAQAMKMGISIEDLTACLNKREESGE